MDLEAALTLLSKGLHASKREALEVIKGRLALADQLAAQNEAITEHFMGPSHEPPADSPLRRLKVARPAILAAYWRKGDWHCLRIEERTVGFLRPKAYWDPEKKQIAFRNQPVVLQWMGWVNKIAEEFEIAPLTGPVRLVLYPGQRYTFAAWRAVPRFGFETQLMHPQDPDNAIKPLADALQTGKQRKFAAAKVKRLLKKGLDPEEALQQTAKRLFGGWEDDTQIVDMNIYRLAQQGEAIVDRAQLRKARRANKKVKTFSRAKTTKAGVA